MLVNGELPAQFISKLKDKGLVSDLCSESGYYYSIVQDDSIISEKYDSSPFIDSYILDGTELRITTKGYSDEASIMIGDGEYCPEEEPLDIVVIDKETDNVIDSVGLNIETGKMVQY